MKRTPTATAALVMVLGLSLAVTPLFSADGPVSADPPAVTTTLTREVPIMEAGQASAAAMIEFISRHHVGIDEIYVKVVVDAYLTESGIEGVNHDVAVAQMCLETDYLRFTGSVHPTQYNFAGMGVYATGVRGLSFPNVRTGVRAHVQHLKAYATDAPLEQALVDPRFHLVQRGSATTTTELTGRWATDPRYGEKLGRIIERLWEISSPERRGE